MRHAFLDCPSIRQAWILFRNTRRAAGLTSGYTAWEEVSRGQMNDPPGPNVETNLQWDTAAAFTINSETPWDILRAQLLWATWCQKVAHVFKDEHYHLGLVLLNAWRNTVYCAMEAYKELFRHKRNEEKRQQMITCFQQVWTASNIFGRMGNSGIRWNVIPHPEFLPKDLGAWTIPPLHIIRTSPSPDVEAEFTARPDFQTLVQEFVQGIARNTPRTLADIQVNTLATHPQHTSRSKSKCYFGPKRQPHRTNQAKEHPPPTGGQHQSHDLPTPEQDTEEVDALLKEIDTFRQAYSPDNEFPQTHAATLIVQANNNASSTGVRLTDLCAPRTKSRPKQKYRFGPLTA